MQPFPGPGRRSQVSTGGGAQVRWRHDGRELYYIALDDRLMAVPMRLASESQTVDAGAPVPLFLTDVGGALQGIDRQQYMVSPDGQRFLMNTVVEEAASPITVILNWKPPVAKRTLCHRKPEGQVMATPITATGTTLDGQEEQRDSPLQSVYTLDR